jgi:hypothetical protein
MKNEAHNHEKRAQIEVIEGYCPNCWGYQEYQGKIYDAAEKANVDLNNVEKVKGWIQGYAEKNFQGLKFEKRNGVDTCPACVSSNEE